MTPRSCTTRPSVLVQEEAVGWKPWCCLTCFRKYICAPRRLESTNWLEPFLTKLGSGLTFASGFPRKRHEPQRFRYVHHIAGILGSLSYRNLKCTKSSQIRAPHRLLLRRSSPTTPWPAPAPLLGAGRPPCQSWRWEQGQIGFGVCGELGRSPLH